MTCAKREVICLIFDKEHRRFASGTNACANPQKVCPREEGEGYEKCKTICRQSGHAEMEALATWFDAHGSEGAHVAYVIGHGRACSACLMTLGAFGISVEVLGDGRRLPHAFPGTILSQND